MSINSSRLLTTTCPLPTSPPLAIPHKFTSNCCFWFVVLCYCQWNQPLLSVFATVSVFALSRYWSYATVALPQDWQMTQCKLHNFNLHVLLLSVVLIELYVVYLLLLACVSILNVCLCCCACCPPLTSAALWPKWIPVFFLSFRSLTIGRAPCSDVSDEHTEEATECRQQSCSDWLFA